VRLTEILTRASLNLILFKLFYQNQNNKMVKVKAICRNEKEHVKQTNNELQRV